MLHCCVLRRRSLDQDDRAFARLAHGQALAASPERATRGQPQPQQRRERRSKNAPGEEEEEVKTDQEEEEQKHVPTASAPASSSTTKAAGAGAGAGPSTLAELVQETDLWAQVYSLTMGSEAEAVFRALSGCVQVESDIGTAMAAPRYTASCITSQRGATPLCTLEVCACLSSRGKPYPPGPTLSRSCLRCTRWWPTSTQQQPAWLQRCVAFCVCLRFTLHCAAFLSHEETFVARECLFSPCSPRTKWPRRTCSTGCG